MVGLADLTGRAIDAGAACLCEPDPCDDEEGDAAREFQSEMDALIKPLYPKADPKGGRTPYRL